MKTPQMQHLHAIGLSLVGLLTLAVSPMHAGETFRWGHGWFTTSNPSMELKITGNREAHVIVPVVPMTISQIAFYGGSTRTGEPVYRVGVQGDDDTPNHFPNGQWLGGDENYAETAIPATGWLTVTLPAEVALAKGGRYHLVIEAAMVDNGNLSSICRNHQNDRRRFRIQDGVYDETVGWESFKGSSWTRSHAFPIVAIDTNANKALGSRGPRARTTPSFPPRTIATGRPSSLTSPWSRQASSCFPSACTCQPLTTRRSMTCAYTCCQPPAPLRCCRWCSSTRTICQRQA